MADSRVLAIGGAWSWMSEWVTEAQMKAEPSHLTLQHLLQSREGPVPLNGPVSPQKDAQGLRPASR